MKRIRLFLITLSVLAGSAGLFAAIVHFGSATQTEWTATAADGCDMGSTVTLDGVVVTLGSADDTGAGWSWHAGNGGLLPSQMPSTEGTVESLITSFSATAPFGLVPTHGAFLKIEPTKMLTFYALANVVLCVVIMSFGGYVGLYAMLAVSFFMSIIYPTQFSLALHGLGEQTKSGSAFLVMAIVGNACVPQFTAYIMHQNETFYQVAYIVPLVCFAVCAFYGYKYKSLLKVNK